MISTTLSASVLVAGNSIGVIRTFAQGYSSMSPYSALWLHESHWQEGEKAKKAKMGDIAFVVTPYIH